MTTDRNVAGRPWAEYDGLPALLTSEAVVPLIHPYAPIPMEPARALYITPGGGRLQIVHWAQRPTEPDHTLVTLEHRSYPAQLTAEKNAAFQRLARAVSAHCVRAGCRPHPAYEDSWLRIFEVPTEGIEIGAFVRAVLAVELGDMTLTDRLLEEAEALTRLPARRAPPELLGIVRAITCPVIAGRPGRLGAR